jgi:hypothetical protein
MSIVEAEGDAHSAIILAWFSLGVLTSGALRDVSGPQHAAVLIEH